MTTAVSTFVFFSTNSSLISRLIRRITNSPWSHMGIGFNYDDGSSVYYECLFGGGFQGPKKLSDLIAWHVKSPNNQAQIIRLNFSPELSDRKQFLCSAWVDHIGYNAWQIICMWYFECLGKYLGMRVPASPRLMVCSESVTRILFPDLDLRDPIHNSFDEVSPGSCYYRLQELLSPLPCLLAPASCPLSSLPCLLSPVSSPLPPVSSPTSQDAPQTIATATHINPGSAPSVQSALCSRQNAAYCKGDPQVVPYSTPTKELT